MKYKLEFFVANFLKKLLLKLKKLRKIHAQKTSLNQNFDFER